MRRLHYPPQYRSIRKWNVPIFNSQVYEASRGHGLRMVVYRVGAICEAIRPPAGHSVQPDGYTPPPLPTGSPH